jgi:hypothetical protein
MLEQVELSDIPGSQNNPFVFSLPFDEITYYIMSRGSAVGIATSYRLDNRGIGVSCAGKLKNFHFFITCRPNLGSDRPPTQ